MRVAAILTLCLVGVVSASSLNKRSVDLNEQAQQNLDTLRAALLNRFDSSDEVAVSKRDIQDILAQFGSFAQSKTQEALKNIKQALDSLIKGNPFFQSISDETEDSTERSISKRDIFDTLGQLNEMAQAHAEKAFADLQKAFQGLFNKNSDDSEDSTEKPMTKRDIFEQLGKLNEMAQAQAQKAFQQLQSAFENLFKGNQKTETDVEDSTEKTVSKRDLGDLFRELAQAQAQKTFNDLKQALNNFLKGTPFFHSNDEAEDSTESTIVKRDYGDLFKQLAQAQAEETMSNIKEALSNLFGGSSTTKSKRDVFDFFGKLNEFAQSQAQKGFNDLQKAFEGLFKGNNAETSEDSTESTIVKRDYGDLFKQLAEAQAEETLSNIKEALSNLFGGSSTTKSKRDIFDFFGQLNEKLQNEAAKIFGQSKKPADQEQTKVQESEVVEEIEVVTSA